MKEGGGGKERNTKKWGEPSKALLASVTVPRVSMVAMVFCRAGLLLRSGEADVGELRLRSIQSHSDSLIPQPPRYPCLLQRVQKVKLQILLHPKIKPQTGRS